MSGAGVASEPIRIGISSCLLGEAVRYDGGHKRDAFLVETLGKWVEWVPVCPEVEAGLGTPRETLRLVRASGAVRLVMAKSGRDLTESMRSWSAQRAESLAGDDLCGYVLKKSSPSCGMERVRVYDPKGVPSSPGRGLFAEALMERWPLLPVEEEGRLSDPALRESFVERVFAYRRLKSLFRPRWGLRDLVAFHTAHKLQVLAHSPEAYRALGRIVARAKGADRDDLRVRYEHGLMGALAVKAARGRHVNVLQHVAGYFREHLGAAARADLLDRIEDYRKGLLPLVVPVSLVRHYVRVHAVEYLAGQTYLEPHPKELMLRNHV